MQATADTGEAHARASTTDAQQVRPVRLLVPTERRSDYYLSPEGTLRASDLGITRHTTDAELVAKAAEFSTDHDELVRLRDALRHPRDIAEARAWGFDVPEAENAQEFEDDRTKRLGWWWVYDPTRTETQAERRARYLSDRRMIDTKGFARIVLRAYITVKDLKALADHTRRVLSGDLDYLRKKAEKLVAEGKADNVEQAEQGIVAKAKKDILKAMPVRRDRAGQSDQWYVSDAAKHGRDVEQLDEWYEFNKIKQTGRPRGSRTRNRRPKVTQ